jgi:hypothetical protein
VPNFFFYPLSNLLFCLDEDDPDNGEDKEGEATTSEQESEDEQGLMSPASQSGSGQASSTGAGKGQILISLFISNLFSFPRQRSIPESVPVFFIYLFPCIQKSTRQQGKGE